MLFDIIMTRFEPNYNPNIIYDASCKVKEYGLNEQRTVTFYEHSNN